MGEAKRRKLAAGGRIEDYRVRDGKVALTIDVTGADHPVTCEFEAAKLTDLMQRARTCWPSHMSFHALVRGFAGEFVKGKNLENLAIGIATTAFYHPQSGASMRAAVSRALGKSGRAHITWAFDSDHGLAIALADQFVELAAPLAAAARSNTPLLVVDETRMRSEPTTH